MIKTLNNDEINYHLLENNKFKTVTFVVKFKTILDRETVTKRALIPLILAQGSENYPSEQLLNNRLDELYGADLSINSMKKGNYHIVELRLEVANEKFIKNETKLLNDSVHLLNEILLQPRIENDTFIEQIVQREKLTLANKLNAIKDDKLTYANQRLIDLMYPDDRFSIHTSGYLEDLDAINAANLYEYYQSMLKMDDIDIYVLGDIHVSQVAEQLTTSFQELERNADAERNINHVNKPNSAGKEVTESEPISQAKLHMGYTTECTINDENYYALQVFNGLFGAFPNSRLFTHVREKHSLAYYVASRVESFKGLLMVYSGIDGQNSEKTQEIIASQLASLQAGEFSDEEMQAVQQLIVSSVKETLDSRIGTIELFYQQQLANNQVTPELYMDKITKVTKDAVIAVAQRINLNTVFLLNNDGGEA